MYSAALLADIPEWAFDINIRAIAKHALHDWRCDFFYVKDFEKWPKSALQAYDVVFAPYHRWPIGNILPWDRTLGSLRAQWFYPEEKKDPGIREFELVNKYAGFHVVNQHVFNQLNRFCPNAIYLTNPVDTDLFCTTPYSHEGLIACWNGNAKHKNANEDDVKGFNRIIKPVLNNTTIPFIFAEYNSLRIAPESMPSFYSRANIYVCMSLYEGASNSVMEAMASGLALISTNCGNIKEMYDSQIKHFGESGILLINRSQNELAESLILLSKDMGKVKAMGQINQEEIQNRWSWNVWKEKYRGFFQSGIRKDKIKKGSASNGNRSERVGLFQMPFRAHTKKDISGLQ